MGELKRKKDVRQVTGAAPPLAGPEHARAVSEMMSPPPSPRQAQVLPH
jgi:hypothetical protein